MPLVTECGSACGAPVEVFIQRPCSVAPVIVQIPGPAGGSGTAINPPVTYTIGTPATPLYPNLPAIAYDPSGTLPLLGWNISTQTWV